MSDSPNHSRSRSNSGLNIVTPHHVTDHTILDSVAGFINEVVPTANTGLVDTKDQIQWASFEHFDSKGIFLDKTYETEKVGSPAVILALGYTTGVQVWAIPSNGEATEILGWRHGYVRLLRFIVTPSVSDLNKRDVFASKRPLVAICECMTTDSPYNSLNFMSLKTGDQVKAIKFGSPILDVFSNSRSVVVTFHEKVAVFDAFTLEDRLIVTSCYISPGLQPNPVALGARWLAYAEKRLNPSKKSNGGNDGEGVQSYTATVLHAAKSLGKGLREFGESFASSLAGTPSLKLSTSPNSPQAGGQNDFAHKGVVTILDIESPFVHFLEKNAPASDPVIAHFAAHTEAIVYLKFDPSGMLIFTADKRGHDFHLFRIQPHPGGPALAAVHHLYILHRGDTTARVQDMCFSPDSRWASVSTLRGTTHVFPITPYGGNVGVRTHTTSHVVNKMSRYHRSAGLTVEGRSNSPVAMFEAPSSSPYPYLNPRYPPYPRPTVVNPLAQIRQPVYIQNPKSSPQRPQTGRQRLSSSSEENVSLGLVACFAPPRAWLDTQSREIAAANKQRPVESLFVMSCSGMLIQYELDPHQVSKVPKERVSSETPIELTVWAKAQWFLQRKPSSAELPLPMTKDSLSFLDQEEPVRKKKSDDNDELWVSQVEIITHAGPHRRLWMGPQFTFKTITTGSPFSLSEAQPVDLSHSKPMNMPITKANAVLIESTSASSCEQSLLETYHRTLEEEGGVGESKLKEDLADAMLEPTGIRETGGRCVIVQMKPTAVAKIVNSVGAVINAPSEDDDEETEVFEEVIHENCDEALFRPIVAPKTIACRGKTKHYGDDIITKSLGATTEVAVTILKRGADKIKAKSREASSRNVKEKPRDSPSRLLLEENTKSVEIRAKPNVEAKIVDSTDGTDIEPPKPVKTESDKADFDVPPFESEDFFSLETLPKSDAFEDARDCEEASSAPNKGKRKTRLKVDKSYALDDSSETNTSEENVLEEKSFTRRTRKPKAKLGVKIANINNENLNTEKTLEQRASEITVKKSWSSIASSKSAKEKSLIDHTENEKDSNPSLPTIEFTEEFTVRLPRKSKEPYNAPDLIDISLPPEKKTAAEVPVVSITADLLKLDKSSDDDKGESSSSPGESDDSGKVPDLIFEDLTDSKIALVASTKSSRRRRKKK
ncbi:breast carcinoma-amplified sequence 3 homolog isoform X2 [Leptinotarsa decemlineata]